MHPWLSFGSPVRRPSFATQGWANWRGGRADFHRGIDLSVPTGSPVYSVGDGVVVYVRPNYETSDAGNWIGIRHDDELLTRYIHLSKIQVIPYQRVSKGQQIGLSGCTGTACAGPHLHFDAILPQHRLSEYVALFGQPTSGFKASDFGYKVPAEPLIPIDRYDTDVVAGAQNQRIPLYGQVDRAGWSAGGVPWLAIGAGLAVIGAGYFFWTSRRATMVAR